MDMNSKSSGGTSTSGGNKPSNDTTSDTLQQAATHATQPTQTIDSSSDEEGLIRGPQRRRPRKQPSPSDEDEPPTAPTSQRRNGKEKRSIPSNNEDSEDSAEAPRRPSKKQKQRHKVGGPSHKGEIDSGGHEASELVSKKTLVEKHPAEQGSDAEDGMEQEEEHDKPAGGRHVKYSTEVEVEVGVHIERNDQHVYAYVGSTRSGIVNFRVKDSSGAELKTKVKFQDIRFLEAFEVYNDRSRYTEKETLSFIEELLVDTPKNEGKIPLKDIDWESLDAAERAVEDAIKSYHAQVKKVREELRKLEAKFK